MPKNQRQTPFIYHLGSEYALAITKDGHNKNRFEFVEWPEPFSGEESKILGTIEDFSDAEVEAFIQSPVEYQRKHTQLHMGNRTKEIEMILPELLVSIEQEIGSKELYSSVVHSYQLAGRQKEADQLMQKKAGLEATNDTQERNVTSRDKPSRSTPYSKEQVVSLYTRYLSGEGLTYDERSQLVAFDQRNNSFEQMQMRLEGLEFARLANPTLNLSDKEQGLLNSKGDAQAMQEITSKEYYEQSKNEKSVEQKQPIPLVHTMDRDLREVNAISGEFLESQLEEIKRFLDSYSSSNAFKTVKLDFDIGVQVIETDTNFLFSYMINDGVDVTDTYTNDIREVITNSLSYEEYPTLAEDTQTHMTTYLAERKQEILDQLATVYDIQNDQAFQSTDYEKVFQYPKLAEDREIMAGIHQQRSEKIVDWAYKGTYTPDKITEYKNGHILSLQKKVIEGHTFYQIDEHMELMMNASKEVLGGYKGILFDESGGVDTFTVKDSKAAATKLFELGASPCPKSSLNLVKQFLSDNQTRSVQQQQINNRVMQETYREETGRSMTGRG